MARERRLLLFFSAAYVLNSLWFKCCDGAAFVPGLGCGQDQPVEVIKDKIEGPEQIIPCSLVYDVKGFQKHYVENLINFKASEWTSCSSSCGLGVKSRQWECFKGEDLAPPEDCDGFVTENVTGVPCQTRPCPVPVCTPAMVIQSADIAWGGYEGHGMHKVLTDDGCEHRDPFNYFVGENLPEHKTIFDFGCMVRFVGVKIRNAMNVGHSNSGVKLFEVSSSTDQTAWTQVLEHELPDPRALGCNIPLVELGITPTVGRFIELKLKSYHGVTYALRFFSVDYELVN